MTGLVAGCASIRATFVEPSKDGSLGAAPVAFAGIAASSRTKFLLHPEELA